jgi:gelsolin
MALKPRKFDVEASNILDVLNQPGFQDKMRAAAGDPAVTWKGAGDEPGMHIWRVERNTLTPIPKEQHGTFYSADDYIVLRTTKTDSGKLHDIHFWVGEDSNVEDYGFSVYRTAELDTFLGGTAVQHREIQGYESPLFISYFKTTHFHDGAASTGKREHKNRLLHLKGTKNVVSRQVPLHVGSLNSGDVFIIDAGKDVYLFEGKDAGAMERVKGAELTKAIASEHAGAIVHNVKEGDDNAAFWKLLGGKGDIAPATPDTDAKPEKRLLRLSDETGKMQMIELKPVSRKALDTKDAFVLDAGTEIFVWVGKNASAEERYRAIGYATDYIVKQKRPRSLPISRVVEGNENEAFFNAINV